VCPTSQSGERERKGWGGKKRILFVVVSFKKEGGEKETCATLHRAVSAGGCEGGGEGKAVLFLSNCANHGEAGGEGYETLTRAYSSVKTEHLKHCRRGSIKSFPSFEAKERREKSWRCTRKERKGERKTAPYNLATLSKGKRGKGERSRDGYKSMGPAGRRVGRGGRNRGGGEGIGEFSLIVKSLQRLGGGRISRV